MLHFANIGPPGLVDINLLYYYNHGILSGLILILQSCHSFGL